MQTISKSVDSRTVWNESGFVNRNHWKDPTQRKRRNRYCFQYGWCIVGSKRTALWVGTPSILLFHTCAPCSFLQGCNDCISDTITNRVPRELLNIKCTMPNFCAAPNCTRKSTQSDLAFFRFPRDPERYDFFTASQHCLFALIKHNDWYESNASWGR